MTAPTEAIPRMSLLAFAYELIGNDLLVDDDDGTWRRVGSITGTKTITVTFDDATTQDFPRRTFLTIYRDRAAMPPAYANIPPSIIA